MGVFAMADRRVREGTSAARAQSAREAGINLWMASAERRPQAIGDKDDPQSDPARLQPRPVDLPRRPDYFIATSTFEWYPGVQIHHSTDLVNWRLVKRPLDRAVQLDMRGAPDFRRHMGAVPVLCRRAVLAGLYRRQAARRQLQGCAQLHRHGALDRRPMVGPGLRQFLRLRSVALP